MSYDIEKVERAALEDLNAAATGDLTAGLRKQSTTLGSAFVSLFAALPATAIETKKTAKGEAADTVTTH